MTDIFLALFVVAIVQLLIDGAQTLVDRRKWRQRHARAHRS